LGEQRRELLGDARGRPVGVGDHVGADGLVGHVNPSADRRRHQQVAGEPADPHALGHPPSEPALGVDLDLIDQPRPVGVTS
jgi:hypothetical protein